MTATSPAEALESAWHAVIEVLDRTGGAGIDLVEVESLRQLITAGGQEFIDAAWTIREQQETNCQAEGLAGKWAAKEAVMKVLRHGIGDLDPRDVEIVTEATGAPRVELHRAARTFAKQRRITAWHISLTHEEGWAAAIVIASSLRSTQPRTAAAGHERRNNG